MRECAIARMRELFMKTILVTGGTGAVGPRVVEALVAEGYAVRILALDVPQSGALPLGVELRIGSVTDPDAVRAAVQGCEGVIHMAALLHIVNPPPALRTTYEAVNVGGTRTVLEAAQAAGVQRVVFFSTIAVYGYGQGGCQTDQSESGDQRSESGKSSPRCRRVGRTRFTVRPNSLLRSWS